MGHSAEDTPTRAERIRAGLLGVLALAAFAGSLPALVESQGVSALMLWPVAGVLGVVARSLWRG